MRGRSEFRKGREQRPDFPPMVFTQHQRFGALQGAQLTLWSTGWEVDSLCVFGAPQKERVLTDIP